MFLGFHFFLIFFWGGFYFFWDFIFFWFFFVILFFFGVFLGFYVFLNILLSFFCSFPECVARVPVSLWGLRLCSLDVAFVVATVRNRPQPFVRTPYGRAYEKFCRGGHFWRLPMRRCFVSRGRRGTS